MPVLSVDDTSQDLVMTADKRQFCLIHVHSADLTSWTDHNEPGELYVEIRMDQVVVQRTKAVKQSDVLFWDEKLPIIGNSSSILSLSIIQGGTQPSFHISGICSADLVLETLLDKCTNHAFIILQMTWATGNLTQQMATIRVQTTELADPQKFAVEAEDEGIMQLQLFESTGSLGHLKSAISNMTLADKLTDGGHPAKAGYCSNLGIAQQTCFEHLGDLSDLENAISNKERAVQLTDDGHPDQPEYLSNLGSAQQTHFKCLGDLADLENVISNLEKAVQLTDDGNPQKPGCLSNLGGAQQTHFECLGGLSNLENAISNLEKAVQLTDDGHLDQPMYLSNLGSAQQTRFECLGDLSDIENAISNLEKAVQLTDDKHTNQPMYLLNLGNAQQTHFEHLSDFSDFENAILNKEKAVQLTDDGHPNQPMYLSNLGIAQETCFEHLGDLSNLENAILNLEKAVQLTDDEHPEKPGYLSNLSSVQQVHFKSLGDMSSLENAILNLEKAVHLTDDGHLDQPIYLSNLGNAQQTYFEHLGDLCNLENAISNLEKAVQLTDDGHSQKSRHLLNLGIAQQTHFERLETLFEHLGDLSDLKNAITNLEKAVQLTDNGHPQKPGHLSNLGNAQQTRFEHLNDLFDLENAISNKEKAVQLTDDEHPNQPMYLSNLGNAQQVHFECLGNFSDLENAISSLEKAVQLTDDEHPQKPGRLSNLGNAQKARFECLSDLSDIENAISNHEKAVHLTEDDDPNKARCLFFLGTSQTICFQQAGHSSHLAAGIASFQAAAHLKAAYPSYALCAAQQWAQTSHVNGDLLSALDGYHTALELLGKIAWLGLNTSSHQNQLLNEQSESLGCCAVNCAINLGQFENAIELLDMGHSIFWQQASSLRSDLETLREEAPELAENLERVGHLLNAGIFSDTAFTHSDQHSVKEIGKECHHLVDEWDELVECVRQLPLFKYFLQPIPFHQLRQASSGGQVVIINSSIFGVDALIFSSTGPIEWVPLPDINLPTLVELAANIVPKQAMYGSATQQQNHTNRHLKPALRTVWNNIVSNIFKKIHIPSVDHMVLPHHRIWWYLTGPLTFIPIHAAGPGGRTNDVSKLVVSSYVTTLGSLFKAHKRYQQASKEHEKLLIVAQPQTPGQSSLPQTTKEVNGVVHMFCSLGWSEDNIVCLHGSEATVDSVSSALDSCSWIHFACHGFQDTIHGMKSAFLLHDGHLEIGKIASKRLSNGQFAFLSACQVASGLKDLPGEAMHLAAGLQFAGFPSIIATIWNIYDEDAPKVADETYQFLFRNGIQTLNPSEAAMALNCAILCLQKDPSVTVDRWAPFVHFGI